mmetsp:Transcript_14201/g.32199  ORF Transcript_14201/g.32199 Transcript_14201/m.32199 type:complete len:214 (-) Transcript_14201:55-696(-)
MESRQADTDACRPALGDSCWEAADNWRWASSASFIASIVRCPCCAFAGLGPFVEVKFFHMNAKLLLDRGDAFVGNTAAMGVGSAKCATPSIKALLCAKACCNKLSTCRRHSNRWSRAGSSTLISMPSLRSASRRSHVRSAEDASFVCRTEWLSSTTVPLAALHATDFNCPGGILDMELRRVLPSTFATCDSGCVSSPMRGMCVPVKASHRCAC